MQIQTDMEQQQKSVFTGCEQPALMMAHGDRVSVVLTRIPSLNINIQLVGK